MSSALRRILVGACAAVALAAATSSATANRLALNETGFVMSWGGFTFSGGGSSIICSLTLRGGFHSRTITKTLNGLIGTITSARAGGCLGDGTVTVLTGTLPWHVTYGGFGGRLPSISTMNLNLIGVALQFSDGISCLISTSTAEPLRLISRITFGQFEFVRFDEFAFIDLAGGFLCELAGDSSFSGIGTTSTSGFSILTLSLV